MAANLPLAAEHQADLKAHVARREKSLGRLRTFSGPVQLSTSREHPISLFVLGPSRSGKTSLERLVSSLDGVKVGCEIPIVERAVRRSSQAAAIPTSSHLEDLPAPLLSPFRQIYLEDLARRAGSARVFTYTGHIHNAGLIAGIIPNARFLLIKRSSEDVVWRIDLTKYLYGNPYAYDLKAIRDYLDWYNAMTDLIAEKLPDTAQVVSYEALADDPAAALRRAAELCGLSLYDPRVPPLPNDCGCSAPYQRYLEQHGTPRTVAKTMQGRNLR